MNIIHSSKSLAKCITVMATLFLVLMATIGAQVSTGTSPPPRKDVLRIGDTFSPSGWMGDGELGTKYLEFSGACKSNPHSSPFCFEIEYKFSKRRRWAGIYWLNVANNFGKHPGEDYSGKRIRRLSFWARGKNGDEVVEFKSGGIKNAGKKDKKYQDSFEAKLEGSRAVLSREWRRFEIDLSEADLSSVIGGFCWVASADFNKSSKITFYLDDIVM